MPPKPYPSTPNPSPPPMPSDPLHHRKLCGFLRAVLAVAPPHDLRSFPPRAPCSLLAEGPNVGFLSEDGVSLLSIRDGNERSPPEAAEVLAGASTSNGGQIDRSASRKRQRRGVALVNGSRSVIHQLHALVAHKCVEIEARVVMVAAREEGGARAVVLVDIYLPIAVWSGWQFPRLRAVAASLFEHLSCNWEVRNSMLSFDHSSHTYREGDDQHIWSYCDCHVLGCEMHQKTSVSGNKRIFNLHEVFRSLSTLAKQKKMHSTRIKPEDASLTPGIWDLPDDVLNNMLTLLGSKDLVRVAATCHHLRSLAASIMPCMKLKLFPHQEAAVEWMLKRERHSEVLAHPLYKGFCTEDGFSFYINTVSGDITTGTAPTINDFHGGMFCDEPGLGKTVTALSLILKSHGTMADPPHGVDVTWCMHRPDQRCGYYELSADNFTARSFMSTSKRFMGKNMPRDEVGSNQSAVGTIGSSRLSPNLGSSCNRDLSVQSTPTSCDILAISTCTGTHSVPAARILRCTKSLSRVKRNLVETCKRSGSNSVNAAKRPHNGLINIQYKKLKKDHSNTSDPSETWVQCDACRKWRKLSDESVLDATAAWFCSMNSDSVHQTCAAPEESWDLKRRITYLPGFYTKGTPQGKEQNITFFTSVLKEHFTLFNAATKKALTWLARLSNQKLLEMETVGLIRPVLDARAMTGKDAHGYHKIFQAFGLVRRFERDTTSRWYYPPMLDNLAFDSTALRVALTKPLDMVRFYLSRATLIVVPANLIGHWKTQIEKHVSPGQLHIYIWGDNKTPCAHNLAWDYDIVITTFRRLSAEWNRRKRSVLMQIHWLRVMLDEGHTLGSSLCLTNKLQMAISLAASSRWILTGTPTPNTPNSQVGHLHPILKFLHEEVYGQNQESWEAGIQRPFEAQMEEGRLRLLRLLERTMISARKVDLKNIPPCIKKITFLHFNEEHAKSYNELVATVRRNILMADWNDPSHVESLLNPKQWKFRSTTIMNVRLSCCVAGHIKVTDAGEDIQETMDILVQQGLDPLSEEYTFIRIALLNGCSCFRCKDWCRLPVVTPCRHLLCLDCVALDSTKCTLQGCGNYYEMQCPESLTRPENPNPKWPVPKDLIELQPSYKQDNWDPDWQSTSSSKVAYLVERLKHLLKSNKRIGYCLESNNAIDVPISVSSNHEIVAKADRRFCGALPDKVIVFSQFLEHIHIIEQQMTIAGITYVGMYSPMHSTNKMKSLMIFQHDRNCMVLLMDGSAALGLDLSFVTHVFLMEPIWDGSMEEQVISRAHRMGASRPIHVETLAMFGTIEEQMLEFLQDLSACRSMLKQEISRSDCERTRNHRTLHDFAESNYLAQLTSVKTRDTI